MLIVHVNSPVTTNAIKVRFGLGWVQWSHHRADHLPGIRKLASSPKRCTSVPDFCVQELHNGDAPIECLAP